VEYIEVAAVGVKFAVVLTSDYADDAAFFEASDCLRCGRLGNSERVRCLEYANSVSPWKRVFFLFMVQMVMIMISKFS